KSLHDGTLTAELVRGSPKGSVELLPSDFGVGTGLLSVGTHLFDSRGQPCQGLDTTTSSQLHKLQRLTDAHARIPIHPGGKGEGFLSFFPLQARGYYSAIQLRCVLAAHDPELAKSEQSL